MLVGQGLWPLASVVIEEGALTGIDGWFALALAASSLGSATVEPSASAVSAQGYGQPSAWETYKVRLAMLAAQQGVSQATIASNKP